MGLLPDYLETVTNASEDFFLQVQCDINNSSENCSKALELFWVISTLLLRFTYISGLPNFFLTFIRGFSMVYKALDLEQNNQCQDNSQLAVKELSRLRHTVKTLAERSSLCECIYGHFRDRSPLSVQYLQTLSAQDTMQLIGMGFDERSSTGVDIHHSAGMCRSLKKNACAVGNVYLSTEYTVYAWELMLSADKVRNECVCFGVASYPVSQISYDANETSILFRAMNGKVYKNGVIQDQKVDQCRPGNRVRFIADFNQSKLFYQNVTKGQWYSVTIESLENLVPVVFFYSTQREVTISSPMIAFKEYSLYQIWCGSSFFDMNWDSVVSIFDTNPYKVLLNSSTNVNRSVTVVDEMNSFNHKMSERESKEYQNLLKAVKGQEWACQSCTYENRGPSSSCEMCGSSRPSDAQLAIQHFEWSCPQCTFCNNGTMSVCSMCESPSPPAEEILFGIVKQRLQKWREQDHSTNTLEEFNLSQEENEVFESLKECIWEENTNDENRGTFMTEMTSLLSALTSLSSRDCDAFKSMDSRSVLVPVSAYTQNTWNVSFRTLSSLLEFALFTDLEELSIFILRIARDNIRRVVKIGDTSFSTPSPMQTESSKHGGISLFVQNLLDILKRAPTISRDTASVLMEIISAICTSKHFDFCQQAQLFKFLLLDAAEEIKKSKKAEKVTHNIVAAFYRSENTKKEDVARKISWRFAFIRHCVHEDIISQGQSSFFEALIPVMSLDDSSGHVFKFMKEYLLELSRLVKRLDIKISVTKEYCLLDTKEGSAHVCSVDHDVRGSYKAFDLTIRVYDCCLKMLGREEHSPLVRLMLHFVLVLSDIVPSCASDLSHSLRQPPQRSSALVYADDVERSFGMFAWCPGHWCKKMCCMHRCAAATDSLIGMKNGSYIRARAAASHFKKDWRSLNNLFSDKLLELLNEHLLTINSKFYSSNMESIANCGNFESVTERSMMEEIAQVSAEFSDGADNSSLFVVWIGLIANMASSIVSGNQLKMSDWPFSFHTSRKLVTFSMEDLLPCIRKVRKQICSATSEIDDHCSQSFHVYRVFHVTLGHVLKRGYIGSQLRPSVRLLHDLLHTRIPDYLLEDKIGCMESNSATSRFLSTLLDPAVKPSSMEFPTDDAKTKFENFKTERFSEVLSIAIYIISETARVPPALRKRDSGRFSFLEGYFMLAILRLADKLDSLEGLVAAIFGNEAFTGSLTLGSPSSFDVPDVLKHAWLNTCHFRKWVSDKKKKEVETDATQGCTETCFRNYLSLLPPSRSIDDQCYGEKVIDSLFQLPPKATGKTETIFKCCLQMGRQLYGRVEPAIVGQYFEIKKDILERRVGTIKKLHGALKATQDEMTTLALGSCFLEFPASSIYSSIAVSRTQDLLDNAYSLGIFGGRPEDSLTHTNANFSYDRFLGLLRDVQRECSAGGKSSDLSSGGQFDENFYNAFKCLSERLTSAVAAQSNVSQGLFLRVLVRLQGESSDFSTILVRDLLDERVSSISAGHASLQLIDAFIAAKCCYFSRQVGPISSNSYDEVDSKIMLETFDALLKNLKGGIDAVDTLLRLLVKELRFLAFMCDKHQDLVATNSEKISVLLCESLILGNPAMKRHAVGVLKRIRSTVPCSTFDIAIRECGENYLSGSLHQFCDVGFISMLFNMLTSTFYSAEEFPWPHETVEIYHQFLQERFADIPGQGYCITVIRDMICNFFRECLDVNTMTSSDVAMDWHNQCKSVLQNVQNQEDWESNAVSFLNLTTLMYIMSGYKWTIFPGAYIRNSHSEKWSEGVLSVVCEGIENNQQLFGSPALKAPSEDLMTRLAHDSGSMLALDVQYGRRHVLWVDSKFFEEATISATNVGRDPTIEVSALVNKGRIRAGSLGDYLPVSYNDEFTEALGVELLIRKSLKTLNSTCSSAFGNYPLSNLLKLLGTQVLQRLSTTRYFIDECASTAIESALPLALSTSPLPRFLRTENLYSRLLWLEQFRLENNNCVQYCSQRSASDSSHSLEYRRSKISAESLQHLQALGYGEELCLKALEFNQFDANAAAQWLLSGQAEAFVQGGGLENSSEQSKGNNSLALQAKDLALAVGKHPKLSQHALEMYQGNENAATEWLLDYGNYYSELPEYSVSDSTLQQANEQCIELKESDYSEENALHTVDEDDQSNQQLSHVDSLNEHQEESNSSPETEGLGSAEITVLPIRLDKLLLSAGGVSGTRFPTGFALLYVHDEQTVKSTWAYEKPHNATVVKVAQEYPVNSCLEINYGDCDFGKVTSELVQLDLLRSMESIGDVDLRNEKSINECWKMHIEAVLCSQARRLILSSLIGCQSKSQSAVSRNLSPKSYVSLVKLIASGECVFDSDNHSGAVSEFGSATDTPILRLLRSFMKCSMRTHVPAKGSSTRVGAAAHTSSDVATDDGNSASAFMKQVQIKVNRLFNLSYTSSESGPQSSERRPNSPTDNVDVQTMNASECETLTEQLVQDTAWNVAMATKLDTSEDPIVRESLHPHFWRCQYGDTIRYPGAKALMVKFDARCELNSKMTKLDFYSSRGKLIRTISTDNMDLSQIVVHGDTINFSFTSHSEEPSCWGFKFYVSPVKGIQWITEYDVLNQSSLEWSCWILEFLLRLPFQEEVSTVVDFGAILNALLRYIRHPSAPFKTHVVYILIKAFRCPQLSRNGTPWELRSLDRVTNKVESLWKQQRNEGNVFVAPHMQAVAEMCAMGQKARLELSCGFHCRRFDPETDVIQGGMWRKAKLRTTVCKADNYIKSENDVGAVEAMRDVTQICEALLVGGRPADHIVCLIATALTQKDSWNVMIQGSPTLKNAVGKISEKKCEEVVLSLVQWSWNACLDLCKYTSSLSRSTGDANHSLSPAKVRAEDIDLAEYPSLEGYSEQQLQSMFAMIQLLNRRLMKCLELVDLSRASHEHALANQLRQVSFSIFSETKQTLVKAAIDATWENISGRMKCLLNNNLAFQTRDAGIKDPSLSQCIFMQAFWQLGEQAPRYFRARLDDRMRLFEVKFQGEDGVDWGGIYRDAVMRMIDDVFSDNLDLCIRVPNALNNNGTNADKFLPNPRHDTPLGVHIFRFLGRLMGIACRQEQYLPILFPSFVWKKLVGQPVEVRLRNLIDANRGSIFTSQLLTFFAVKRFGWCG